MELQAQLDQTKSDLIKLQTKYDILKEDMAEIESSLPDMIKESTQAGLDTERTRVMSILEKCIAGKKTELIEDLVKNANTPEQAAALIMQSKALESEHEQVSSATSGVGQTGPNLLLKNADERAQAYTQR